MHTDLILTGLAAAPIITALVAVIAAAVPALPRRLYPVLAVGLGVAWSGAAAAALSTFAWQALLQGVVVGLAASGLYSGAVKPALAAANEAGR